MIEEYGEVVERDRGVVDGGGDGLGCCWNMLGGVGIGIWGEGRGEDIGG